jgi:triacylglycerol lipase
MATKPATSRRVGRRSRVCIALLTLVVASLTTVVGTPGAQAQTAQDPIVFVHGWNSSASTWNTMINRFIAAGYPRSRLLAFTYNSNTSNATIANQVRDAVSSLRASTGATKVDVITHSMGGLSGRYYLRNLGGTTFVDDWVSLGGPNHGTNTAYLCYPFSAGCRDMIPGSGFLNALNSGDETPGSTNYGTFWSNCDTVINPDSSVLLSGATNTGVGCVGHTSLHSNATVFNLVRNFVAN